METLKTSALSTSTSASASLKSMFCDRFCGKSGVLSDFAVFSRPPTRFDSLLTGDCAKNLFVCGKRSYLFKQKNVPNASDLSVESEVFTETIDTLDTLVQTTYQTQTVRVKFQLQKECEFGQHFLLVGGDPMFGFWDPLKAVPLSWSDGHVWSVELDIPVGKTIQFKFILEGTTDEIEWQPGPDRILSTWETKNTIVVLEDWFDAALQQITEEECVENQMDKSDVWIEEPLAFGRDELLADATKVLISAESNGRVDASSPLSEDEEEILNTNGGIPVLVPGLVPSQESSKEASNHIVASVSVAAGESTGSVTPELPGKQEPDLLEGKKSHGETLMNCDGVNEEPSQDKPGETMSVEPEKSRRREVPAVDVLKNDVDWGRRTLEKILMSLGFYADQLN